jgi:uncharacterized membrane protein
MIFWLQVLKAAHIVSATIIFGTGLGIAFFTWFGCRHALRSGSIETLRAILRLTVIADACLTAPAVAFQAASGVALMAIYRWPYDSPWAIAVGSLFAFAGACWLPVLWIQVRLRDQALKAAATPVLPASFRRLFRAWLVLGVLAFAAVLAIYWLMVAQPLIVV